MTREKGVSEWYQSIGLTFPTFPPNFYFFLKDPVLLTINVPVVFMGQDIWIWRCSYLPVLSTVRRKRQFTCNDYLVST